MTTIRPLERRLDWDGAFNVRDLGGLPVRGGTVAHRALIRADSLQGLTPAGWAALTAHGVRTVIDLRNDDERGPDASPRPAGLTTLALPLDGIDHRDFWDQWTDGPQFGTPLYYLPHLRRFPERSAAVVTAIAQAPAGGVVFHCVGGRDRTGQVAMILLALLGATATTIADDYALTDHSRPALAAAQGFADDSRQTAAFLAGRGTSVAELIAETLAGIELEPALRAAGVTDADLAALRRRAVAT